MQMYERTREQEPADMCRGWGVWMDVWNSSQLLTDTSIILTENATTKRLQTTAPTHAVLEHQSVNGREGGRVLLGPTYKLSRSFQHGSKDKEIHQRKSISWWAPRCVERAAATSGSSSAHSDSSWCTHARTHTHTHTHTVCKCRRGGSW